MTRRGILCSLLALIGLKATLHRQKSWLGVDLAAGSDLDDEILGCINVLVGDVRLLTAALPQLISAIPGRSR